jgi:acyl-CoA synthetase (NDP forming)
VKFSDDQEIGEGGTVSVAGQSGTNSSGLIGGMQRVGVKVARGISFGNAAVVNEADYLEYFLNDPQTEVVVMYIEGLRDGRRFFELLRETARRKPVVLWRGGRSAAGARAVQSHTASLASSTAVWDAMLRQTGAIGVGSLDEAVDVTTALVHTTRPSKRGIALIGMNGGQAVALTDQFSQQGFEVPPLSNASYERLAEFFVAVGSSYRNPFDASSTIRREDDNLQKILEVLAEDGAIDCGVAIELGARDFEKDPSELNGILDLLDNYREKTGQPVVALMHDGGGGQGGVEAMVRARRYVAGRGFAVFPSYERGAIALGRVVTHFEGRDPD